MIYLIFKWSFSLLFPLLIFTNCEVISNDLNNKTDKLNIVISFDDQHESIYYIAVPLMIEAGFKGTNFINTGYVGKIGRLSWEQIEKLEFQYGWETGGHTLQHVWLPQISYEDAHYQVEQDWRNLKNRGLSHESFALPSGAASLRDYEIISMYYKNIRNSRNIRMRYPIDRMNIGYFAVKSHHNVNDIIRRINDGIINKEDLIMIGFHRFNDPEHTHNCSEEVFGKFIDFLQNHNINVATLKELEYLFY